MSQTDIKNSRSKRSQNARRRRNRLLTINLIVYCLLIFVFLIAIKNVKSDKKALRNEGVTLYQQGDYKAAASKFEEALAEKQWFASKLNADICLYRADSLAKIEDYAGASRAYRDALDYKYGSFMKKSRLEELIEINDALFQFSCAEYNTCFDAFVKAVDEGYTELAIFAALCCDKKGDLENMKKYMDMYIEKYGYTSYLYYQTAVYYTKNDNIEAAVPYIDNGLALSDDSHRMQLEYLKIAALRNNRDFKDAYKLAKEYVAKYPEDEEGRRMYEYLDTRVNVDPAPLNNIYDLYYSEDFQSVYDDENDNKANEVSDDAGYESDYEEDYDDEYYEEEYYDDEYYEEE
ncbi:MAG: hypothetical protein IKO61_02860 [Lachnospiraceae bacterium]|nr:hypothetical protein [Lachnospiraceae bacterium]